MLLKKIFVALWAFACCSCPLSATLLPIVPWPQNVQIPGGVLALSKSARITFLAPELANVAETLSNEIFLLTQVRLAVVQDTARYGDISLIKSANPQ